VALPEKNEPQYAARKPFDPIADAIRGLIKLTARVADLAGELADLNKEAANLAAKIQENFEELGI